MSECGERFAVIISMKCEDAQFTESPQRQSASDRARYNQLRQWTERITSLYGVKHNIWATLIVVVVVPQEAV